jgi:hypothetical protein
MQRCLALFICMVAISLPARRCIACNIPVFRYALERWPVQSYVLTVFHTKPLSATEQKHIADLQTGNANLEVADADLSASADDQTLAIWHAQHNPPQPWAVLSLPMSTAPDGPGGGGGGGDPGGPGDLGGQPHAPATPAVWAGSFDKMPDNLTDSPVRRDVMNRILKGDSAVWVLVDSGDAAKDRDAAKQIDDELKQEEQNITLVRPNPDDPGPQLMSPIPLKLNFSVIHVTRSNAVEAMFLKLLYACDSTHASWPQATATPDKVEPVAFVIFGRGRALPPLVGKQINADNIDQVSQFVTGPCACEIKDLNPGTDLLTSTDWEAGLSPDSDDSIPATRPATPIVAHTPLPASVPIAPGSPPPPQTPSAIAPAPAGRLGTMRSALFTGIGIASLGLIVSGALLFWSRSKPKLQR